LIDDDPARRNMLTSALRLRGWRVTTFVTGYGALNRIRELQPDLLLICTYESSGKVPAVDWLLPRIDSRIIVATLDLVDFAPITADREIPVIDAALSVDGDFGEAAVHTQDTLTRRTAAQGVLRWGDLAVDPARRRVYVAGIEKRVRRDDYSVLALLLERGSKEVTDDDIRSTMRGMFGKTHCRSAAGRLRTLNSLVRSPASAGVHFAMAGTGGMRAAVAGPRPNVLAASI